MPRDPIFISVRSWAEDREVLAVSIGGQVRGEAVVEYEHATATIAARVDLPSAAKSFAMIDRFHEEFAAELMAYVMNRGAMAQESEGAVTYTFGETERTIPLPSHEQVGLGYPNSW